MQKSSRPDFDPLLCITVLAHDHDFETVSRRGHVGQIPRNRSGRGVCRHSISTKIKGTLSECFLPKDRIVKERTKIVLCYRCSLQHRHLDHLSLYGIYHPRTVEVTRLTSV